MHFYLYDQTLSQPKLMNELAAVETRLTDLGLQGRVGRLGPLKSAKDMVHEAIRAGATTIVAVGTDHTVAETVNAVAGTDVAFGILPIGEPSRVASLLGIQPGNAVDILAARKIETVDLGKINNLYFLTAAELRIDDTVTLECDERYTVTSPMGATVVTIANLQPGTACQDGFLEATIDSSRRRLFRRSTYRSTVPFRFGRLAGGNDSMALVENTYTVRLPTTIEIIPRTLRVIVGRDRVF